MPLAGMDYLEAGHKGSGCCAGWNHISGCPDLGSGHPGLSASGYNRFCPDDGDLSARALCVQNQNSKEQVQVGYYGHTPGSGDSGSGYRSLRAV